MTTDGKRISALSNEFRKWQISATEAGTAVDLSALAAPKLAFIVKDTDISSIYTWAALIALDECEDNGTGEWETEGTLYFARIRISGTANGGTVELARNIYDVYINWTDSPEIPIQGPRELTVY